jgi:1-phosphatidylinositol phosphodiesterase
MANSDWMHDISGTKYLPQLAIPGTHDSGACVATSSPMTRAQNLSISEQLAAGVRALDIRCAATWGSNYFVGWTYDVFHGPFDQGITIAAVVADVVAFLGAHTDEVVLLMLKQEGGSGDISTDINKIVNDGLGAKLYRRNAEWKRWPRLSECRGQALVLSRLQTPHASHYSTVGWPDNCKNTMVNIGQDYDHGVRIQDLYKSPPLDDKKEAVSAHLTAAKNAKADNQKELYLNFSSLVWKPWEPVWSGDTHMTPYLKTLTSGLGVVCVDAVTEELATHIISWNG